MQRCVFILFLKGDLLLYAFLFTNTDYLRVVIVAETFSEGVMVYFQLSDLCRE